jgi:hypothetical protein
VGVTVAVMPSLLITVPVGTPISVAKIFATIRGSSEPVRPPLIKLKAVEGPFFSEFWPLISLGFLDRNLANLTAGALEFVPR